MTKAELIERIGFEVDATKKQVEEVLTILVVVIKEELDVVGKASIHDLGTFRKTLRPAHTGRNPKTGEPVEVGEKASVKFKASKNLKS